MGVKLGRGERNLAPGCGLSLLLRLLYNELLPFCILLSHLSTQHRYQPERRSAGSSANFSMHRRLVNCKLTNDRPASLRLRAQNPTPGQGLSLELWEMLLRTKCENQERKQKAKACQVNLSDFELRDSWREKHSGTVAGFGGARCRFPGQEAGSESKPDVNDTCCFPAYGAATVEFQLVAFTDESRLLSEYNYAQWCPCRR